MNKYIVVTIIAALVLGVGGYFFVNSQKDTTGQGHNMEDMSGKPVAQSHRSYEIEVTSNTSGIQPDKKATIKYKIKNDRGEILKNYETVHEKIMHFIVVRKDLQNFQHLHPEFNQSTGEFTVDITFPTNGSYRIFPDFTPSKDNPQKLPVTVYHDINAGDMNTYKDQSVVLDTSPKKTIGEYQITYNLPLEIMMRNEISYSLTIEKNGQQVRDLENYLGALGHSVILKEGSLNFIHTHAEENDASRGPEIKFSTSFQEEGVYKIFTQFQHMNKVLTVDYTIMVN